jgi:SSS family solute:Na+ symporter
MNDLLPNGVLGVAVTGLIASFMAGMAANVSGFNTVFTYDIWQTYVRKDRPDEYYLRIGRIATVGGIVVGIGTAFIAAGFSNIMNYIQALFSLFNAPLFATFIIGMFWKRMSAAAGFWSLASGTAAALALYLLYRGGVIEFNTDLEQTFWGAGLAFVTVCVVAVVVTLFTPAKRDDELRGLVYGMGGTNLSGDVLAGDTVWWRSPVLLGAIALALSVLLYLPFL